MITWETSLVKSWEKVKPVSFTDVVKSTNPILKDLVAKHSEIKVMAILTLKIENLIKFFNIGKSMGATQIAETITLILENYPRLKPDDIELCFKKAKSGQYGQLYDRLDGQVILGWIFAYTQSKDVFIEHNNFMLHKANKGAEYEATPEMKKAGFELLRKSYVEPLKQKEIEERKKASVDYTKKVLAENNQEHKWIEMFDSIQYKQGYQLSNGTRFINRYGKKLTTTDYLMYKAEQLENIKYAIAIRKKLNEHDF